MTAARGQTPLIVTQAASPLTCSLGWYCWGHKSRSLSSHTCQPYSFLLEPFVTIISSALLQSWLYQNSSLPSYHLLYCSPDYTRLLSDYISSSKLTVLTTPVIRDRYITRSSLHHHNILPKAVYNKTLLYHQIVLPTAVSPTTVSSLPPNCLTYCSPNYIRTLCCHQTSYLLQSQMHQNPSLTPNILPTPVSNAPGPFLTTTLSFRLQSQLPQPPFFTTLVSNLLQSWLQQNPCLQWYLIYYSLNCTKTLHCDHSVLPTTVQSAPRAFFAIVSYLLQSRLHQDPSLQG